MFYDILEPYPNTRLYILFKKFWIASVTLLWIVKWYNHLLMCQVVLGSYDFKGVYEATDYGALFKAHLIFLFHVIVSRKKYSAFQKIRKSLKIIIILLFKNTYRTDIKLCSISITKLNVFSRKTISLLVFIIWKYPCLWNCLDSKECN